VILEASENRLFWHQRQVYLCESEEEAWQLIRRMETEEGWLHMCEDADGGKLRVTFLRNVAVTDDES
jgi:hypothetical protein